MGKDRKHETTLGVCSTKAMVVGMEIPGKVILKYRIPVAVRSRMIDQDPLFGVKM